MGYDKLIFLDDHIDDNLKCAICFGVCEEATTACISGHTFCAECLKSADRGAGNDGGKCPTCRADKINAPNRPLRGVIDALRARCGEGRNNNEAGEPEKKKNRTDDTSDDSNSNPSSGCDWEGKLGDWRDRHQKECPYVVVQCPDCREKGLRRMDIDEHKKECKWHKVECDLCHEMIHRMMMDHHKKFQCQKAMMECPFCGEEMTREELGWESRYPKQSWSPRVEQDRWNGVTGHKAVCPKMMLYCEFDGCGAKFKREDGPKHHADYAQFHAALVNQAVDDLRHWDLVQMYWNIPRSKLIGSGYKVLRSQYLYGATPYELYLKLYLGGRGDPIKVAICSDSINCNPVHRYASLKNIGFKVARDCDCDEDDIVAKIGIKDETEVEIKYGEEVLFQFSSTLKKYDDEDGVSERDCTRSDLLDKILQFDDIDGEEVQICICASLYVKRHIKAFLSCDDA